MKASDKILELLEEENEITFSEVERLAAKGNDHKRFYPLAQLIESEYVGCTTDFKPVEGAEKMKEFSTSIYIHMLTIKPDSGGIVRYENVSTGSVYDRSFERFFLKSKGFLYLIDKRQRKKERWFGIIVSIVVGILVGTTVALVKDELTNETNDQPNKAVDTTAANARLLGIETSKSTISDQEASTGAAVV